MIFFTDIDNTLIFSERRKPKNSICVEYKDNEPITYMTENSIKLYKELCEKITVVPVTTRSKEQFMRIENIRNSKYAIVANGAKLLVNGIEDKEWTDYFISYVKNFNDVFEKCRNILKNNFPDCHVRMADDVFMYSRLDENVHTAYIMLSEECKNDNVTISESHGKIYIIPKQIGKDYAIKYFCQRYNIKDKTVSAGDSLMDMNMLLSTDMAIAMCGELEENIKGNKNIIWTSSPTDTEFILKTVLSLRK